MPDRFSREERSRVMRAVKSASTEPEALMRALLSELGLTCREQATELPGKPDFVCDDLRLVVFVDGDWWHGRDWIDRAEMPAANAAYWGAKFERNVRRDRRVTGQLRSMGWSVVRIWESDLRAQPEAMMNRIARKARRRARSDRVNRRLPRLPGWLTFPGSRLMPGDRSRPYDVANQRQPQNRA